MLHLDFNTAALAAALLGSLIIVSTFLLSRVPLIPGRPKTFSLLSDNGLFYRSSLLSPFSSLRGRLEWFRLARSRGLSSTALADQILQDDEQSFRPRLGTPVCSFDRVVVWDNDCIEDEVLESWSRQGDVLADKAVHALSSRNQDTFRSSHTLDRLLETTCSSSVGKIEEVNDFLSAAECYPPAGSGAVSQAWYDDKAGRNEKITESEVRAEETKVLARARMFFLSNGHILFASLLHAGLIGGFASPRIVKVLNGTGYLMSPSKDQKEKGGLYTERLSKEEGQALLDEVTVSTQKCKDRVYRRLLETLHFLLDVVEDDTSMSPPGSGGDTTFPADSKTSDYIRGAGVGWLAATRVRLLHAGVRKRLRPGGLDGTEDIVPISQDEMVGTLCLFSVAPLWSLDRMGLSPSKQERSDYVSLWRHVGYYMGIESTILARTFRDVHSAERAYACVASYHFRGVSTNPGSATVFSRKDYEAEAVVALRGPALPLLHSVAGRPGAGLHFSVHIAVTRYLLGDSLADALYLPKSTPSQYIFLHSLIISLSIPFLFVKYYPRKAWTQRMARVQQRAFRGIVQAAMLKSESSMKESDRKQGFFDVRSVKKARQEQALSQERILLVGEVIAVCSAVMVVAVVSVYFLCKLLPT